MLQQIQLLKHPKFVTSKKLSTSKKRADARFIDRRSSSSSVGRRRRRSSVVVGRGRSDVDFSSINGGLSVRSMEGHHYQDTRG